MAFNILNFAPLGNQSKRGKAPQSYTYRSADSLATILAANYFSTIQTMLDVDDMIQIEFVDSFSAPAKYGGLAKVKVGINVTGLITAFDITEGKQYVVATLADVSTASTIAATSSVSGRISKITAVLGGTLTVANSALTFDIDGVAIGGSAITVAFAASTLGTAFTVSPTGAITAANGLATSYVVPGSVITATTDGASTSAAALYIVYEITQQVPNEAYVTIDIPVAATTVGTYYVSSPIAGTIVSMSGTVSTDPGAGTGVFTTSIMAAGVATAITNGVITFPNGAVGGNQYQAFPTAANVVSAGQTIRIAVAGAATNAFNSSVQILIKGS